MLNQITQDQLGQLQQHLIVPLAVSDILRHDLNVEQEMQYGLHMALSEIDPDSALLAIALCARDLAAKTMTHAPISLALQQEADKIVEEYAPTWLYHFNKGPMTSEEYESVLENIPEDLEALADLMDAVCADLDDNTSPCVILANLLSIQARAHMEIAAYVLAEIQYERAVETHQEEHGQQTATMEPELDMDSYKGSNIILFPTGTRH